MRRRLATKKPAAIARMPPSAVKPFCSLVITRGLPREVLDDDIAEHRSVALTAPGFEQVAVEQRLPGVPVRDAEHAVGADQHVQVDGVNVAPEHPRLASGGEDAL